MAGTIFLKSSQGQVGEAAGSFLATIARSGSLAGDVVVTYGVTGDGATAGQDFVGGTGSATMPAGAAEVAVPVAILDDAVGEPTETLVLSLVNVAGATLGAPRTQRVAILDDETPAPPPEPEPPLSSDYAVTQTAVVSGLDQPIRFVFSPLDPSKAFVAEKGGVIRIADLATGTSGVLLDIRDRVNAYEDRGLLDAVLHPNLPSQPYLYAFYVVDPPETAGRVGAAGPDGDGNRYAQVVRFTLDPATGFASVVPGSEAVLLGGAGRSLADVSGGGALDFTDPALAGEVASDRFVAPADPAPPAVIGGFKQGYLKVDSASHTGGKLAFGPDGALYVSTGDGTSFNYADPRAIDVQSLDSLSGKILRLDPITGRGLADNPFVAAGVDLGSNQAKVFQYGLRNPFSMAFDAEGRLFITDAGWKTFEEIDLGGPGANFGWPFYEGGDGGALAEAPGYRDFPAAQAFYAAVAAGAAEVTAPFRAFANDEAAPGFQVQAITGGSVVYDGGAYPAEFRGRFFFTDVVDAEVFTIAVDDRTDVRFLFKTAGPYGPVHYAQGPDGRVYYADLIAGTIGRLDIAPLGGGPGQLVLGAAAATAPTGTGGDDTIVG
jgi:glucose/arabinose dehydrogenase